MVKLGIMIEGQEGLTLERWNRIVAAGEDLGFDSVWRSDHLFSVMGEYTRPTLAVVPSMAAAALWSRRIELGVLVSPTTFRHPVHLATEAVTLDHMSNGRFWFGIGAGWNEAEHAAFGFPLPPLKDRMDRFEEALRVVTLLWSGERVTFEGTYFQLKDAQMTLTPTRNQHVPTIIGGSGEKRTLRLVAQYADEWNVSTMTREMYAHKREVLAEHCKDLGRDPGSIRQSLMLGHIIGRTRDELLTRASTLQSIVPSLRDTTPQGAMDRVRERGYLVGTVDEVIAQIQARAEQGVERIMLQTFDQDDIDGLRLISEEIIPNV